MHIAILTFDGFNELDSLIALSLLGRIRRPDWRVSLAGPTPRATSWNGVTLDVPSTLVDAARADAVIVGSGSRTRSIVADDALMATLQLDPARQLVAAQCSGALVLQRLGLLDGLPACADRTTTPWLREAGATVQEQAFHARGNIATAGGCLASVYLATWVAARLAGLGEAEAMLRYVAPVGEEDDYVARALAHISPALPL